MYLDVCLILLVLIYKVLGQQLFRYFGSVSFPSLVLASLSHGRQHLLDALALFVFC